MSEQPPYPPQEPDPQWAPPSGTPYGSQYPPPPPPAYGPYYAPAQPNIPPGVTLASWGIRLGALLIDGILSMVLGVVAAVVVGFTVYAAVGGADAESAGWAAAIIAYLLFAILWFFLYAPLMMRRQGARNGQTLAKQWLRIRVIREDGYPVTAGTGFLRNVLMQGIVFGFIGSFFMSIPTLLDGLWPLWDDRNQCLHDKAASTLVIEA